METLEQDSVAVMVMRSNIVSTVGPCPPSHAPLERTLPSPPAGV